MLGAERVRMVEGEEKRRDRAVDAVGGRAAIATARAGTFRELRPNCRVERRQVAFERGARQAPGAHHAARGAARVGEQWCNTVERTVSFARALRPERELKETPIADRGREARRERHRDQPRDERRRVVAKLRDHGLREIVSYRRGRGNRHRAPAAPKSRCCGMLSMARAQPPRPASCISSRNPSIISELQSPFCASSSETRSA
jgi:hypothetical protein